MGSAVMGWVWGASGREPLDAAVQVPWGLRGGRRVGDTRRALSGRGGEGVPGLGQAGRRKGGRLILKGSLFTCALLAPAGGGASARSRPAWPRRGLRADPAPCPFVGAHWTLSAAASGFARLGDASHP